MSRKRFAMGAAVMLLSAWSFAEEKAAVLTIDAYTQLAVEKGVKGKETEMTLLQAGYSRDVVMRQTAFPTLGISHTHERGETNTNGVDVLADTKHTDLNLTEKTPLGTQVNANAQYGDSNDPTTVVGHPTFKASVQQPVYLFVKNATARQRRETELSFSDAESTYKNSELSLRAQARSFYYNVMLGEESIEVERRRVTSTQKLLDVTRALVDAGRSAPVELMRAKIRQQVDRSQLDNAMAQRDQSVLTAKNFAYLPLDKPVRFVTQLEFARFQIPVERLIDYALIHQPNLQILRRAQKRARLDYDAAVEPTRPTLSVGGTYSSREEDSNLLVSHGWTWTGAASWLFFDSFVTYAQVKSARIGEWVADLNLEDGERTARVNIRTTYINLKNAEKQILEFQLSLEQAKRNVDVVRLRFQNGLERLIDVFDAENDMRDLDNQYLNLLVQFNQNKDQLSQLIGADVDTLQ